MTEYILSRTRIDYKWLVFLATAVGTFVSVLDQSSVNLALPKIAEYFSASIPAVQWVALGYGLTTGALLLPMGRLSDIIGRKKVYVTGFVIFTLGALLTGSSTSLNLVVAFKIFQAVGAAMVQGTGMAIVTSTFGSSERGKVIGLFLTVVGVGAIAGPIVGGTVVGLLGWRFVFFMGIPFGIASIIASALILDEKRISGGELVGTRPVFDWAGAALSTTGLVLFLLVMTNGYRLGWSSPIVVSGFGLAVFLGLAFVWWERRVKDPMLSLELFQRKLFTFGSSASFLSFLAGTSVFFLMPFYLQKVLGYSPGQTGIIIAPTAIAFATFGPLAGRLSDRFGWQKFALTGIALIAISLWILSNLTESSPLWVVLLALVIQGVGMGTFFSPNASAVLSTVERTRYGVATAYLNMVRNTANVTGIAIATTVITIIMASHGYEPSLEAVSSGPAGDGVRIAFAAGLRTAFMIMFGFALGALVLTLFKGKPLDAVTSPLSGPPNQPLTTDTPRD